MFKFLVTFALIGPILIGFGQDTIPFKDQVYSIIQRNDKLWDATRETIVFTGSSSIALWTDLEKRFPEHHILNAGFGGSHASHLFHYLDTLVLRYQPKKVFIYEGDNDLLAKKTPKNILATLKEIVTRLKTGAPEREIILISAKPSPSRWKLRKQYQRLNRKIKRTAMQDSQLYFVDIWTPMLEDKKIRSNIFIEDGLHMNPLGYDIWYKAVRSLVDPSIHP
ncbi:MAG: GDSL-type esterase/lipase family protein [Bacteroidota bacterium]